MPPDTPKTLVSSELWPIIPTLTVWSRFLMYAPPHAKFFILRGGGFSLQDLMDLQDMRDLRCRTLFFLNDKKKIKIIKN